MQSELLFQIGFIGISSTVLAVVAAGCLFWIQYFRGRNRKNLCGDDSPDLITRLPQPLPRWTVFDCLLMLGIMFMVAAMMQPPRPVDGVPDTDVPMVEPESSPAVDVVQVAESLDTPEQPPAVNQAETTNLPGAAAVTDQVVTDQVVTDPEAEAEKLVSKLKVHFTANLAAFLLTLVYLRVVHGELSDAFESGAEIQ